MDNKQHIHKYVYTHTPSYLHATNHIKQTTYTTHVYAHTHAHTYSLIHTHREIIEKNCFVMDQYGLNFIEKRLKNNIIIELIFHFTRSGVTLNKC